MLPNIIDLPRPPERAGLCHACEKATADATSSTAPLPNGFAFTERAAASLREYLARAGLDGYRVFYNFYADVDMEEVDEHLDALGEAGATWDPLPGLYGERCGVTDLRIDCDATRAREPGCIHLRKHEVVLARWLWMEVEDDRLLDVWLCAAPTFEHYVRLRDELLQHRRAPCEAEWRVVGGGADSTGDRVPRGDPSDADDLMLPDRLRARIEAEVVRFFDAEAAELYASLRVPYRRGVLLHGPPGNGKTSLIRMIGARLPLVPGLILRPRTDFDGDDLAAAFRRWTTRAPGILVIEDLDWLLKEVDVSRFLNLIDGVESAVTGGLLLIATTNHPEKLDPAINNRPGRFDVVIEVSPPDEPLRLAYLRRHLPTSDEAILRQVARNAAEMAFAHLQEIVRLSGLLAINAGRSTRTDDDVLAASQTVRESFDNALSGFAGRLEIPFGLGHLHRARRREQA